MGILTNLSLFSGAGGLDLSAKWTGRIRTVCYVEHDPYAQGILMSRMRDGSLDDAPIWDDVQTFDGKSWRGKVDIVSGGFPCQDLSIAGKRTGIEKGTRSGLWKEFAKIIREVGPRFVLVENVPGLLLYGQLGIVLGDLAELRFDAEWGSWTACAYGTPHLRKRVFIVAYPIGLRRLWSNPVVGCPRKIKREQEKANWGKTGFIFEDCCCSEGNNCRTRQTAWNSEPNTPRVVNGLAFGVDRLRCGGNGVVPQQAYPAWQKIIEMSDAWEPGEK